MDNPQGIIQPKTKLCSSFETVKPNKPLYVFPKYNGGSGIGETLPFQKGEIGKKEGAIGPKKAQNLARQAPRDFKVGEKSSLVRCSAIHTHWGGNIASTAWQGSTHLKLLH